MNKIKFLLAFLTAVLVGPPLAYSQGSLLSVLDEEIASASGNNEGTSLDTVLIDIGPAQEGDDTPDDTGDDTDIIVSYHFFGDDIFQQTSKAATVADGMEAVFTSELSQLASGSKSVSVKATKTSEGKLSVTIDYVTQSSQKKTVIKTYATGEPAPFKLSSILGVQSKPKAKSTPSWTMQNAGILWFLDQASYSVSASAGKNPVMVAMTFQKAQAKATSSEPAVAFMEGIVHWPFGVSVKASGEGKTYAMVLDDVLLGCNIIPCAKSAARYAWVAATTSVSTTFTKGATNNYLVAVHRKKEDGTEEDKAVSLEESELVEELGLSQTTSLLDASALPKIN